MAAPAGGGGGSAVSVLAPNGRRHTVKVTPSTVLLQVLEDTCQRQDFNPSEYDLKFQRNVLDLSLQWRFANLPKNAKLEMVPASRSRQGPETRVRVALQLEDGSRWQDTFCSGQTLWELLHHFPQTRERVEQLREATPVCVYMRDEVTGQAALQRTTLQSLGLTRGSATIRFVVKPCGPASRTPGSPVPSISADLMPGHPQLPLSSGGRSGGDLSHQHDTGALDTSRAESPGPEPVGAEGPVPAPCAPFSGEGRRLGGPPGSAEPLASPSATSPTSSSPGGPSEPKKSKSGQEAPRGAEPPMDRAPVLFHPALEEPLQAWPPELPDEFFEVTVDDVRRRLAQLRSERKRLEEAPLVTRACREAQTKEKLGRYPKVALRVLFPDRYVLQGFFRPSETVGDLRDFVTSHLCDAELPFYLFVAPPKVVLSDSAQTLFQAPTWSPGCWSTPPPRPLPMRWWPGACPGPQPPHLQSQPWSPSPWHHSRLRWPWTPPSVARGPRL
ncbi:tether containing UBX domain for GLUT4 isoform X2 [Dasypus novemcinctus]|uniref:tether containing UBX domain for GLUT4 isoform X2 n=1 Tax=Dasypus novemcinctus TaxID=9361 RepID=UPI00265E293E|nr:tether containing UBX domain for GLUT4 isoform X2 [Dasypus novemcinctus]